MQASYHHRQVSLPTALSFTAMTGARSSAGPWMDTVETIANSDRRRAYTDWWPDNRASAAAAGSWPSSPLAVALHDRCEPTSWATGVGTSVAWTMTSDALRDGKRLVSSMSIPTYPIIV